MPSASVIVRCQDKVSTVGATLRSLRAQTVPVEIVVVDSGSTDGTLDVVRPVADVVVGIERFSYGGALNVGAATASGDVLFALSAHCVAPPTWVADALRHHADPTVAGTGGMDQDFSNHASSFRASVWRQHPFREDLAACEDKEWFWWAVGQGYRFVFDPALLVDAGHRRDEGLRSLWRRTRREAHALARLGRPLHPVADWWAGSPYPSRWPRSVRRLSPYRLAECGGTYAGTRAARRESRSR